MTSDMNSEQFTTMDSLLKEIDDEMSHTDLPLDEIADETMEKLVHYNTESNRRLSGLNFDEKLVSEISEPASLESRSSKSVLFKEPSSINDISMEPESSMQESTEELIRVAKELEETPLETAWVKHKQDHTKPVISKRLVSEIGSDTSVEHQESWHSENGDPEKTNLEIRNNMISDVGERLSHIFDAKPTSNPNIPGLTEMLSMADEKALENDEKKDEKLTFTIESTKPLFPSTDMEANLIEVEIPSNEYKDDIADGINLAPASICKIPLTPRMSINKFSSFEPQTRTSSGSSIEDEQELNTSRMKDQYQLLAETKDAPTLPKLPVMTLQDYKTTSSQQANGSRIFSVATTADNYQSAKEYDSISNIGTDQLSDVPSVEDLKIPDASFSASIPTFQLSPGSLNLSTSFETMKYDKMDNDSSDIEKLGEPDQNEHSELSDVDFIENHKNPEIQLATSEHSSASEEHSVFYVELETTNDSFMQTVDVELPVLPISNGLFSLFDDDLFNDQEISQDSIDITRSLRNNNYLSIWHLQESQASNVSPAVSSNSQFSSHSQASSTTTNHTNSSFKFRSRIISTSLIHQQNNFRHLSDEYIIGNIDESRLDPLRRNTIMSKRIQQEISTQSRMYPFASKNIETDNESMISEKSESQLLAPVIIEKHTSVTDATEYEEYELLPTESNQPVFSSFLDDFEKDDFEDKLALESRMNSKIDVFGGWAQSANDGVPLDDTREASKVLFARVLEEKKDSNIQLGKIQTPDVNVVIRRGDEGLAAQRSVSELSLNTIKQSPLKHVSSPFKIIQPAVSPSLSASNANFIKVLPFTQNPKLKSIDTTSRASIYLEQSAKENEELSNLQDNGKLYIKLRETSKLDLYQIRQHNAKYSIEFDNGKEVIETPWEAIPENGVIKLEKEFEINMATIEIDFFITLKVRYDSPRSELVEIVEKVPIKKKFGFGKPKYRLEKKFVSKSLKYDDWDYKFAKDGSFARCKVSINNNNLSKMRYLKNSFNCEMNNEWARVHEPKNYSQYTGDDMWKLPRAPKYQICSISMDMMYIPRTSSMERFPKNLESVKKCCQKYKEQHSITKEGYLWQEGGDVEGMLKRRYMKLNGTELIAHNEITKKPETLMNLLKVVDVYVDGKSTTGKQMRNFTDMVLFSDCFKLSFANDEIINFNADSSAQKYEWVDIINKVISLNKFHQPWIKRVIENDKFDIEITR